MGHNTEMSLLVSMLFQTFLNSLKLLFNIQSYTLYMIMITKWVSIQQFNFSHI